MIVILDYEMGNVGSIQNMLRKIGVREVTISRDAGDIRRADRLILPGVGAFDAGMERLREFGLPDLIREHALERGKPLLGICLGMQLLFDRSFEYGEHPGLGLVPGEVADLREDLSDKTLKVPHMGWNSLEFQKKDDPLLRDVSDGEYVYYVHSFYARRCAESTAAVSRYGNVAVTGVVRRGNVWGTQFHPEKSGDTGLRILKAFGEL